MLPIQEALSIPQSFDDPEQGTKRSDRENPVNRLFNECSFVIPSESMKEFGRMGALVKPSSKVIQAQATLFQNARMCKAWASLHRKLPVTVHGQHFVIPLTEVSKDNHTLCYFKEGKDERFMEVMVWDIAVLLGWEDLFTPTKLDQFYVDHILEQVGNQFDSIKIKEVIYGSMQTAIEGVLYEQGVKTKKIDEGSLRKAFIAMYLLGLNDVHTHNLMVQDDGTLRLFDNTKCLPHGNQWIFSQEEFYPVHRFVPFELDICHQPLTEEALNEMRQIVAGVRKSLPAIESYFNSLKVVKIEELLPEYWFDRQRSFQNLKLRLDRIEASLTNNAKKSLFNLYEMIYPQYRFAALVYLLYGKDKFKRFPQTNEERLKIVHSYVGCIGLKQVMKYLFEKGYNLPLIQQKAYDLSVNLNDLVHALFEQPEEVKMHPRTENEMVNELIKVYLWMKQFRKVPYDFKDANQEFEPFHGRRQVIREIYYPLLNYLGIGPVQEGNREIMDQVTFRLHSRPYLFKCLDERKWYAVYTNGTTEDLSKRMKEKAENAECIK